MSLAHFNAHIWQNAMLIFRSNIHIHHMFTIVVSSIKHDMRNLYGFTTTCVSISMYIKKYMAN